MDLSEPAFWRVVMMLLTLAGIALLTSALPARHGNVEPRRQQYRETNGEGKQAGWTRRPTKFR